MWRSGAVLAVCAEVVVALTVAGALRGAPHAAAATLAPTAATRIVVSPPDGSTAVAPTVPIIVTAPDDTLVDVTVAAPDGTTLPGTLAPDGHTWQASAPPAYGTTYRLRGTATGSTGTTTVAATFTTVLPSRLVHVSVPAIGQGAVVGVGAPIEVRFDRHIAPADRPSAERGLTVATSVPVSGSWGWLPDDGGSSRVHWRPEHYWPANTAVTITTHLYGLGLGDAGYGGKDLTRSFTIGRSQIVRADVTSHRMVVVRDGRVVTDIPASYGLDTDPRRVTRNGVHVVMTKAATVFMSNPTFGYKNVEMHWAVRISNNGEFIHANPASDSAQGSRNVTHGCVNLTTANAKAYYDTAIFGDPVEVTGSTVALSSTDGDVYDWAIPWDRWQTMSALNAA